MLIFLTPVLGVTPLHLFILFIIFKFLNILYHQILFILTLLVVWIVGVCSKPLFSSLKVFSKIIGNCWLSISVIS
jgi:hypothetical protein